MSKQKSLKKMNRKAAYWNWAISAGAIVLLIVLMISAKAGDNKFHRETVLRGTSDTPQKQYTFVIKISPNEWKAITDTASATVGQMGVSLSVDNARIYQSALLRQFQFLANRISVDSIVAKPKK